MFSMVAEKIVAGCLETLDIAGNAASVAYAAGDFSRNLI